MEGGGRERERRLARGCVFAVCTHAVGLPRQRIPTPLLSSTGGSNTIVAAATPSAPLSTSPASCAPLPSPSRDSPSHASAAPSLTSAASEQQCFTAIPLGAVADKQHALNEYAVGTSRWLGAVVAAAARQPSRALTEPRPRLQFRQHHRRQREFVRLRVVVDLPGGYHGPAALRRAAARRLPFQGTISPCARLAAQERVRKGGIKGRSARHGPAGGGVDGWAGWHARGAGRPV
mmetsp:Transcript_18437/g.39031  ORF Transcript_18437/g.39031 Transcript_18437/m.39031 type:complete len:233 (+) Transcript_18437:954-1652(+)